MEVPKTKIVIGLSGGMDSATLLAFYLAEGCEVHCFSFTYGSKHNQYENQAARDIVEAYQSNNYAAKLIEMDVQPIFSGLSSALLLSSSENIPEGHYQEESMKKTVVPGRNLIFASIMAAYAESIGAKYVALGVHSGDHAIYPDCRPSFIQSLSAVIRKSSDEKVALRAPFLHLNKMEIVAKGIKIQESRNVPVFYALTRTCYKNQPVACGKCGSCQERKEAFFLLDLVDPIPYEN